MGASSLLSRTPSFPKNVGVELHAQLSDLEEELICSWGGFLELKSVYTCMSVELSRK